MCLKSVNFTMKKDQRGGWYGVGYRLIDNYGTDEKPDFENNFKKGRWVTDSNENVIDDHHDRTQHYAPGFHLFPTLKDCLKYWGTKRKNIYEVHFKDIVASGIEKGYRGNAMCIIARKVKLVRKIQ